MLLKLKLKRLFCLSGGIAFLFGAYVLSAFGEEEKTVDQYIDAARPYLHLSCQSAWQESGEDAAEYVAIVNRFVPIMFINYDFDVQRIKEAPEADQQKLRVLFYDEVGRRCKEDPRRLLAGVVESSLAFAFDQMK